MNVLHINYTIVMKGAVIKEGKFLWPRILDGQAEKKVPVRAFFVAENLSLACVGFNAICN